MFLFGLFGLWTNIVVEYDELCVQISCHLLCQDDSGYLWFLGSEKRRGLSQVMKAEARRLPEYTMEQGSRFRLKPTVGF